MPSEVVGIGDRFLEPGKFLPELATLKSQIHRLYNLRCEAQVFLHQRVGGGLPKLGLEHGEWLWKATMVGARRTGVEEATKSGH